MSQATQKGRYLAERIIAHETREFSADAKSPGVYIAIEKLRPHLSILVGKDGFRALLSRALAVASVESRWLRIVHVNANGSLDESEKTAVENGSEQIAEARLALMSVLLELLMTFIGEQLTVHLLREVWPKLRVDDHGSGNEGTHETTK